jgi:hypothetical protein
VRLAGCYVEGDDGTVFVTSQVDLGGKTASRTTERMVKRLLELRPFTPSEPLRTAPPFSPLQRRPC